jgi:choice-of-anchor B domain-containing protein
VEELRYKLNTQISLSYDVTDKTNPTVVSRTSYKGVAYCHQGWVLDKMNQEYLIMDDEYDEAHGTSVFTPSTRPTTYIWDIKNLKKPVLTGHFKGSVDSVDHNQYVYNGFSYQSNYGAGLRVIDLRSIPQDPTGKLVKEVAYFDVFPEDDLFPNGGLAMFTGSWSSFAGFKSGYIFINTIERGGFVVKVRNMPV